MLVPDRAAALRTYQNAIDTQNAQGYQKWISDNGTVVYWAGYLGTNYSSEPSTPRVNLNLNEPSSLLFIDGNRNAEVLYNADVGDYYQVLTDQQTLVAT